MPRRTHRRLHDESGAAAVEFALVLPLIAMLVFGIIYFGLAYNAKVELQGAVREGARVLALNQTSLAGSSCTTSITCAEAAVTNDTSNLSGVTFSSIGTCPTTTTGGITSSSITASYNLAYSIPLVASGTWTLTATGVMRCGL